MLVGVEELQSEEAEEPDLGSREAGGTSEQEEEKLAGMRETREMHDSSQEVMEDQEEMVWQMEQWRAGEGKRGEEREKENWWVGGEDRG